MIDDRPALITVTPRSLDALLMSMVGPVLPIFCSRCTFTYATLSYNGSICPWVRRFRQPFAYNTRVDGRDTAPRRLCAFESLPEAFSERGAAL